MNIFECRTKVYYRANKEAKINFWLVGQNKSPHSTVDVIDGFNANKDFEDLVDSILMPSQEDSKPKFCNTWKKGLASSHFEEL